jgi:hypothetical protein
MLTTRIDRLIALLSFVAVFVVLLAVAALGGFLGAAEFGLLFLLAIPISVLVSKVLRGRLGRSTPPRVG